MSFIDRLFGATTSTTARDPNDDFWWDGQVGRGTAAGVPVTRERALQLPIVQDCLRVIADPIAALPLIFFELKADGTKRPLKNFPLDRMLRTSVNAQDTASHFMGQMQWDLGLYNNAYAEIQTVGRNEAFQNRIGTRGLIRGLHRIDPEIVTVRWLDGARRERIYEVHEGSGAIRTLRQGDMWHLRGWPLDSDGLAGRSQLTMSAEPLSAALALQDYAARFWANDSRPPGFIKHPSAFKTPQDRQTWVNQFRRLWGGRNKHKIGVLEHGMDWQAVAETNEASQFLETKKEKSVDITRIWNVPPHKVGILDRATFSNIEQQSIEFVRDTMGSIFVLWEQAIKRDLISGQGTQDYFCEFDIAALLRGDLPSRFSAYFQGRQGGWLSINDIRRRENMAPIEDGDDHLQPLNMAPVGEKPPEPEPAPQQQPGLPPPDGGVPAGLHLVSPPEPPMRFIPYREIGE